MQVKTYHSYLPQHKNLYRQIYEMTSDNIYPNYFDWFYQKFLTGLKKGNRAYVIAMNRGQLLGCVLLKKSPEECKICNLYVHPHYRRQGVGTQLMSAAIDYLGPQPLLTVSADRLQEFTPLFHKFHFQLSAKIKGLYLPDKTEYIFNDSKAGPIQNKLIPLLKQRCISK